MVKELMQSNKDMRDTMNQLMETNEKLDSEGYSLQIVNRDLRDKIEILESVIAATTS